MAISYVGECRSLTKYTGTTTVSGGSLTGYVKTITAFYTGTEDGTNYEASAVINIPLADPASVELADLTPYDELTKSWAQTKIDNYLPNVKIWIDKEIAKQHRPVEEKGDPPWQGA